MEWLKRGAPQIHTIRDRAMSDYATGMRFASLQKKYSTEIQKTVAVLHIQAH